MMKDDDIPGEPVEEWHDTSQLPSVQEVRANSDRSLGRSTGSTKRWLIVIGVVLLVLVGVVVGVVIGVNRGGGGTPSSVEDTGQQRLNEVNDFLIREGISDETAVMTTDSPQNLAAHFMAVYDEAQMNVPVLKNDPDADLFIDRYAVTVMYYGLGGKTWLEQLNFLSRDETCRWFETFATQSGPLNWGVQCDGNNRVIYLLLAGINAFGSLPPEIGHLTEMRVFVVYRNELVSGTIPDEFRQLSNLALLDLGSCSFSGSLPPYIGEFSKLNAIILSDNKFTSSIPSSISNLASTLTFIGLDGNMLTGEITPVDSLTNLENLYLEHNMFEQQLDGTSLKDLTALKQLDLSDNGFTGPLPVHLLGHPEMDVLDLSDNPLGDTLPEFPENGALNYLFLHGCNISGSIPDSIGDLRGLGHLDLSENDFTGLIPSTMINLTRMVYLFLAENPFDAGPIPEFLRHMPNLRDLSLKLTEREDEIPTWISEFDKMLLLDLHRNKLTGTIPTEFGMMTTLALLLLNRNLLEGTIPDELENMSGLAMLLLDNNTLTGTTTGVCRAPNLQVFITDCGGEDPPVDCPTPGCCTSCCDGVSKCNDGGLLARFDPIWEESYERRVFKFDNLTFGPKQP